MQQIKKKMQHNQTEKNIKQLQNLARKYFSAKDYNSAIDTLNEILQIQPKDISTLLNKGAALFFLNRYYEALECFDRVLLAQPDHLQALKNKAGTLFNLGRYAESNDTYDMILAISGSNEDIILKNKALVLIKLNRIQEAIMVYQQLIAINGQDKSILLKLASLHQQLKQYDQAIATYDKLLEKDATNADLLNKKAILYAVKKSYDKAVQIFDQVLAIDPYNREALLNREDALYHLQIDLLETEEYIVETVEPSDTIENIIERHTAAQAIKEDTSVLIAANEAAKTVADGQEAEGNELIKIEKLINRADSLVVKQSFDRALIYYNQALELDAYNKQALLGKGYVLNLHKDYTAATACYNTVLKTNPNNIKALIQKGQTMISMKEYDRAMSCFEQVLKIDPNNFDAICGKEDTVDAQNKDLIRSSHTLPNFEHEKVEKVKQEEPKLKEEIFEQEKLFDHEEEQKDVLDKETFENIDEECAQEIAEKCVQNANYSNVEHTTPAYIPQIKKLEVVEHAQTHAHLPSHKQESMLDLAVESVQNREYEKALRYFDLVTDNNLHCINTLYYKALAHTYTQQFSKAISCCDMIIEQEPEHLTALNLRTKIIELQKTLFEVAENNAEKTSPKFAGTYTGTDSSNQDDSYKKNREEEKKKVSHEFASYSNPKIASTAYPQTRLSEVQRTTYGADYNSNVTEAQNTFDTGSQRIQAESTILNHTAPIGEHKKSIVDSYKPTIVAVQDRYETRSEEEERVASSSIQTSPLDVATTTYDINKDTTTDLIPNKYDTSNVLRNDMLENTSSDADSTVEQTTYDDDNRQTDHTEQNTFNAANVFRKDEATTTKVTPAVEQTTCGDDNRQTDHTEQNTFNAANVFRKDEATTTKVTPAVEQTTYGVDNRQTAIVENKAVHVDYETQYLFDEANRLYHDGKYEEVINLLESEKESNHQSIKELYNKAHRNFTTARAKEKAQSFVELGYNSLTMLSALGSKCKQQIDFSTLIDKLIELNENDYFNQIVDIDNTLRSNYKAIYKQALQIVYLLQVNQEIENKIAHYTSHRVAYELLIPSEEETEVPAFRLYSIANSNDPKEGTTLFDLFKMNQHDDLSTRHYQAFVGSFSFNTESLNQFRLYSKKSKQETIGVSIVLNNTFFNQQTEGETVQNDLESLYRCIYIDPKTQKIISVGHKETYTIYRENTACSNEHIEAYEAHIGELLKTLKTEFERLNTLLEDEELDNNIVCQLLIVLRYLVKHVAHKDEQECRIIQIEQIIDKKVQLKNRQLFINYQSMNKNNVQMVYTTPLTKQYKVLKDIIWKETGIQLLMSDYPLTKDND